MGNCPDAVKRLIERFDQQSDQVRSPDYNETQLRIDFVNPLFAALGWDIDNSRGNAEQYRQVVHEDRIKVAGQTKAPDYSFRIGGARKFFLEAKKPFVNLRTAWEPAYQLRRYGWSAKLAVSILTDFEELAVYDCRITPKQFDKPATARREYINYREYPDRWDFLEGTFSERAVRQGDFDRYCGTTRGRGRQEFDDTFLEEIEDWRKMLASNLALRNESLDDSSLNFAVQRIIDRIIFLRMAEDRGTETIGQLQALLNGESAYARLGKLFRDADARYNSGLFHFAVEKGRDEQPDTLTPGLEIDDATLKKIIKRLYYPESPYEFTVVTADILGSVYERFLGKVITLTDGHRAKIEEKPEVRKAGGVYYTPTYIVDYIVKNTVGKLLEGKTPKEAARLKVLDPACGSGSFLIGAYQFLLDWHLTRYIGADPQKLATGKSAVLRPGLSGDWRLTIAERKRILLDNIHGVDLDASAVEVTKLNLLLKCLEGETSQTLGFQQRMWHERALPDLGHNILCGNSLIGTDIMATDAWKEMSEDEKRRINPFDYERAFPKAFKQGGFDAVIGNPPYVRQESIVSSKPYFESRYKSFDGVADLYVFFIERGLGLLRSTGALSIIVSSSFLRTTFGEPLRKFISESFGVRTLIDFGGLAVFEAAKDTYVCIPTIDRSDAPFTRVVKVKGVGSAALTESIESGSFDVPRIQLRPEGWMLDAPSVLRLFDRLYLNAVTLGDFVAGNFYRGITTGLNDAFVIDDKTRDALICEDEGCAAVIKPFLRGEDVRRYFLENTRLWIIFARRGINIEEYPGVRRHLSKWKQELTPKTTSAGTGRKPGRYKWFEIQDDTAYFEFFDRAKIVYPDITKEPRFFLDTEKHYPANTVYCIGSADLRLLGFLNSRLFWFCISHISIPFGTRGGKYRYRLISQYMERIPVSNNLFARVPASAQLATRVETGVELRKRLLAQPVPQRREQIQREIDATDRQIDQFVYELYGLTDDEIRIVEEATG
jgi:hypothetical protein